MRYLDANSPCSGFSRHKIDLVASDKMYADIIFLKLSIIEDLYLDKLLFENKGGVSKSEIQSYDVRNDVKQEKFNEGIRHADCFFLWMPDLSEDNGWQVLLDIYTCVEAKDMPSDIKLCVLTLVYAVLLEPKQERPVYNGQSHNNGQYMSIDCTILMVPISVPKTTIVLVYGQEYILPPWLVQIHPNLRNMAFNMPMFSAKTSSQIVSCDLVLFGTNSLFQLVHKITISMMKPLGAWIDKYLTVEVIMQHQKVSTDQCAYWCLKMTYISPDDISFWVVTHTSVCPMININCMCGFECIYVAGIVTFKWVKIVQSTQLLLSEAIGGWGFSPMTSFKGVSVVKAVQGRLPVFLDGGIRRGTDVFKALALGASGVFIGRPVVFSLAVDGEAGVRKVLQMLHDEFELTMALSGCRSIKEISRSHITTPWDPPRVTPRL
ncbi:hypothetical protein H5410_040767 [Solanum commersonii]|uniref:FMN hydroxy acid dehydrogenase domain-containing protein n=1 Tax=Solanum commersonii TaxID=4109 RepID=A0A9J5XR36_SOLCO|nr:hypothetical protein H5410_040767 [Solanum commersonii]